MSSAIWRTGTLALASVVLACGGHNAKTPGSFHTLSESLRAAFLEEAIGDSNRAADLYLGVLESAASSPSDPASAPVAMAALEALVHRGIAAFANVSPTTALADRSAAVSTRIDGALAKIESRAEGPFVPSLIATARLNLAERRGDATLAEAERVKSGCVRQAQLLGPVAFTPVSGAAEPSSLDVAGVPFPAHLPGPGLFVSKLVPSRVSGLGCHLPLYASSNARGVRDVVIDVEVPTAGWIGLGLRSSGAASLHAGGQLAIHRPHALGANQVTRLSRVETDKAGVLRVVARVGMDRDYQTVEVGAWDESGKPLRTRAPSPGQVANIMITRVIAQTATPSNADGERLAAAMAAMAAGETVTAENILAPRIEIPNAPPDLFLAYANAVRRAPDLPPVKSAERARTAYERVLDAWPSSWEAVLEHAVLAGMRTSSAEAKLEALRDLDTQRIKANVASASMLDAFEAATSGRELYDRAASAFARAKQGLGDAPLTRAIERHAFDRTGREEVAFECGPKFSSARSDATSLACHHAKLAVGDSEGAERELERLRQLAGSPQLYLSLSVRHALEQGALERASRILALMNPGDRQLATLYAAKGKRAVPELFALAPTARDAPAALPSLLRAAGDDPLSLFAGVAERVTGADAGPATTSAATAILAHDERYEIEATGLVHFVLLDVRRVMGTADVEANAEAIPPMLLGRDTMRILRRRIFKKDGRVLLPDATPNAAQSHADLSQLETGDAVEAIYEGWSLPSEMGNVGIDTPDLLPERTAVRDARVELRLPPDLRGSMWTHAMLGKPEERMERGKRVLVWHVTNQPVRRIEYGVPKMDRNVAMSFSTTTWADVGRAFRDTLAALESDSPEVRSWAQRQSECPTLSGDTPGVVAVKGRCTPPRTVVEKIVAAAGQAIREASGVVLADVYLGRGGHTTTARTSLATREGSRTWLIVRALRDLGIHTDALIAENEPFSESATFPPHAGRFMHPLAVAHVPSEKDPNVLEDIWIDADVAGPPLPAGHISPELRGRFALRVDGRIAPLPMLAQDGDDEVDERIVVDEEGHAKGVLTVLLRGRSAQDLAEALVRLVGNERQRALRGVALAWVPFATIEKVELSSNEGSWQVAIRAEFTAPSYAQLEGSKPGKKTWVLKGIDPVHYVFPRPYATSLGATFASQGARESALAVNYATQYHVRRRIELPSSARITRLPGPFETAGPLLRAKRSISVAGQTIEEDFRLEISTGTVSKHDYEAFVTETRRTDDAFGASIRIAPQAP